MISGKPKWVSRLQKIAFAGLAFFWLSEWLGMQTARLIFWSVLMLTLALELMYLLKERPSKK